MSTTCVAVIFGGPTPEHEISLAGAQSVLRHAAALGWDVLPVGITKDGRWLVGAGALTALWGYADHSRLPAGCVPERVSANDGPLQVFAGPPPVALFAGVDAVLPVCHGTTVEDGVLQGLLSSYGLRVIGCGVASSAICFDKHLTRAVLSSAGLPVAAGTRVSADAFSKDPDEEMRKVRALLGAGQLFVKPTRGGSSLGITAVRDGVRLQTALEHAFTFDSFALVEDLVPHRELVFGVIGSSVDLTVSPAGECQAVGDLYTYEEKYRLGNPRFKCPADLDPDTAMLAQTLAAAAFRAVGCSVFARVDLFIDKRSGRLLVNEINTIPGLTEVSVFPKVMQAAGFTYPRLLEELRSCAMAR